MDNNNVVSSEDIVTVTQVSSNSNVSDITSVSSTSRSPAGTSVTPAVILASSSYTFPIDYPDSPSSGEMASPSLSPNPSYETKVDTTLEQQSDTQTLESVSVELYQQTETKPDISSEPDTQTLESVSVELYQQTETKPKISSEPDTQTLESVSVELYQQTETKPKISSESDTHSLGSESVESYQQTETKPVISSEPDTQILESESVESHQQTETKPDTLSELDTQTLDSESVEPHFCIDTEPDTSSEPNTQTLEPAPVEMHQITDTSVVTSTDPDTQAHELESVTLTKIHQITDTSIVASADPDTQANVSNSIPLTEMHEITGTRAVASADPDTQAYRSVSAAPMEMHQTADTSVAVLADPDTRAYESESGATMETHQVTCTHPDTSNIQALESETEVMETSHTVTTGTHLQDDIRSVQVDEMTANKNLVPPICEDSSVDMEVSSTSSKDKDENISFESRNDYLHVVPTSGTNTDCTSEMAISEDIVDTSSMATSEDIVDSSEMAASEDIVNTATAEDTVSPSEVVTSEDTVNTATSEEIVNTSEMASAGLDRDNDITLIVSTEDTPCFSDLTQESPVNDSNSPDITNDELTTSKDIPDSSNKEYNDNKISNVTFFNDSSHSVTSSTQSDHIHDMSISYPLTPSIAEASQITTDSCTTSLESKRDMIKKTEEGTTCIISAAVEATVDSQSEVKMMSSNPEAMGVDSVETNADFVINPETIEESRDSHHKEDKITCTTEDSPKESVTVANDVVSQEGNERSTDRQHEEEAAGMSTCGDSGDVQESFSSLTVPRNTPTINVIITSKVEATSDNQSEDEHLMTETNFTISPEKTESSTVSQDERSTSNEKKSELSVSEKTGSAVSVTEQAFATTREEEMDFKNSDGYKDVVVSNQDVFCDSEDQTINSNIVTETPVVETEDTPVKQEPKMSTQHEENPEHNVESSSDNKAHISTSLVITEQQESSLPQVTDSPPNIDIDKTHHFSVVPSEESMTPPAHLVTSTSSGGNDSKQVLLTSEVRQHDNIIPVQVAPNSSSYVTTDDEEEQAMDTGKLLETGKDSISCEDEHMETEEQQSSSSTEISPIDCPSDEQQKTSLQSSPVASPIDSTVDKIQSSITRDILTTSKEEEPSKQTKTDLTESQSYVHADLIKSQPHSIRESLVNPDSIVQISTTTDQSTKFKDDLSTTSTFGHVIVDTENTNIEVAGCHVSQSMKTAVPSVEHDKGSKTEVILESTQHNEDLSSNVIQGDLGTEPTEDQALDKSEEKEQKRTVECLSSPSSKTFPSSEMLDIVRSQNLVTVTSDDSQVDINKNNTVENTQVTVLSKNGSTLQSKTGTSSNEAEASVLTSSPSTLLSVPVTKTSSLSFLLSSPHLPSSHANPLKSTSKPVSTTYSSMSLVSSLPSFSAITASPISISSTSSHSSTIPISATLSSTTKPVTAPTSDAKSHAMTFGSLAKSHVSSVHRVPVVAEKRSLYRNPTPVTSTLKSLMRNHTSDLSTSKDKGGHDTSSVSSIVVMTQSSSDVLPSSSIPQTISTTSSVSLTSVIASKESQSKLSGQTEQTSLSGERDTTSPVNENESTSQSVNLTSAHLNESIKTYQVRQPGTTATTQPPSLFSVSVTPYMATPTSVISAPTVTIPEGVPGGLVSDISVKDEMEVSDVDKVTAQQLKLAQQKLAMLQRHSFSSLYKSTDVTSLERIGTDSQQFVYWYDGGRNMFQSPPMWDPNAKPKESELVLICKSFVQWQNKLKQLRSSCHEADSKLAQTIKQSFLSRVKIATKRKPKDAPSQFSSPPIISTTQLPQQQRQITTTSQVSTTIPSTITTNIPTSINPSTLMPQGLPQGSILVVPSSSVLQQAPGHGFSAMPLLPVFANTAVIMPQNVPHPSHLGSIETHISSSLSHHNKEKDTDQEEEGAPDKIDNEDHPKKEREIAELSTLQVQNKQKDFQDDEVVIQRVEGPKTAYHSLPIHSSHLPNASTPHASSFTTALPTQLKMPSLQDSVETVKLQPHPLLLQPGVLGGAGASNYSHLFSAYQNRIKILKVESESEMGNIDQHTKSLEILGEIPVRKMEVDVSKTEPEGNNYLRTVLRGPESGSSETTQKENKKHEHESNRPFVSEGALPPTQESTLLFRQHHLPNPPPLQLMSNPHVTTTTQAPATSTHSRTSSESNAIAALTELAAQGRTSQEVMSAKMLLSLHGPGTQPTSTVSVAQVTTTSTLSLLSLSTNVTVPTPPLRSKKTPRKQKPVASARASPSVTQSDSPSVHNDKECTPQPVSTHKRHSDVSRPHNHHEQTVKDTPSTTPNTDSNPKKKEYTPQEILRILEIPSIPSKESTPPSETKKESSAPVQGRTSRGRGRGRGRGRQQSTGEVVNSVSSPIKPVVSSVQPSKQVPVEPETESSDSSSGSESSSDEEEETTQPVPPTTKSKERNVPHQPSVQSEHTTSSESSSEEEDKQKTFYSKRGGRGRGRTRGGRTVGQSNQVSRSTSQSTRGRGHNIQPSKGLRHIAKALKERGPSTRGRGQKRNRGGSSGGTTRQQTQQKSPQSLVVKISRKILEEVEKQNKRKRTQSDSEDDSYSSESDNDNTSLPFAKTTHLPPSKRSRDDPQSEIPLDLAKYYKSEDYDLKTLSELTRSVVPENDEGKGSRSKRTCVRVREEITKLQELLNTDVEKGKAVASKGPTKRNQSGRALPSRNQQLSGKGKGKRKSLDEQPLWQSANPSKSGSNMKPKYLFSTHLANQAAEAVWRGKCENVIEYHKSQSKASTFLRLPHKNDLGGVRSRSTGSESETKVNLRPRTTPKQAKTATRGRSSLSQRGSRGGRAMRGRELRRSRRLAEASVPKEESEDDEDDEDDDDEEEDMEEGEEEDKDEESKLTRSAVRKRQLTTARSPNVSTPSSDDTSGESNQEEEDEHIMEKPSKQIKMSTLHTSPHSLHSGSSPRSGDDDNTHNTACTNSPKPTDLHIHESTQRLQPNLTNTTSPLTIDPNAVAPSNQTPDSVQTPVRPPSKEEVNYTICHSAPEARREVTAGQGHKNQSNSACISGTDNRHPELAGGKVSSHIPSHPWSSGLPPQFSPAVHGGYPPTLYNPKLHPAMATAYPHQQVAANYPYPMHYPWPHPPHAHHVPEHHTHQSSHMSSPPLQGGAWPTQPQSSASQHRRGGMTEGGSKNDHKIGQFYSQGSGQPVDRLQQALPTGAHPLLSQSHRHGASFPGHPVTHPSQHERTTTFPYGFEPHPSLAAAHMWPSSQMPHPQFHSLMPHAHLASQSLWPYPQPTHQHLAMTQQPLPRGSGSDKTGKSKSSEVGGSKSRGDPKLNSNQNNNNNTLNFLTSAQYNWPIALMPTQATTRDQCDATSSPQTGETGLSTSAILEQTRLTNNLNDV